MDPENTRDKHLYVLQQTIENNEKYSQLDKCLLNTDDDEQITVRNKTKFPMLSSISKNNLVKTASLKSFPNNKNYQNIYSMEIGKHNAELAQKKLRNTIGGFGYKKSINNNYAPAQKKVFLFFPYKKIDIP